MRPEYRIEPCSTAISRVKGMPFRWSLNPYTGCTHQCTFCYVRAFERRADRPSDTRYGASVRVKSNIAERLAGELRRRSWKGEEIAVGTATDPYQPAEGTFRLTRACLEVLHQVRNPFGLITRGPLVIRDVDIIAAASRAAGATVSISVPTLDLDVWRTTEPGTAPPRQRLRAMRALAAAGVTVNVSISPLIPGLSDGPAGIEAVMRAARDAGASGIWCRALHLQPGTREHFMESLARDWPHLVPRFQDLYRDSRGYLATKDSEPREAIVDRLRASLGFPLRQWRSQGEPESDPAPLAQQLALW